MALFAEASSSGSIGGAKNASEVSREELRDYRNAMSISRTGGKNNGASDEVRWVETFTARLLLPWVTVIASQTL